MPFPSSGSFEELPPVASDNHAPTTLGIGIPAAWWPLIGSTASLVFAIFWMLESWEEARPLLGPTKVNSLTHDVAALLMSLLFSYGIYRFWKERSQMTGIAVGVLAAAAAMTLHRL